MAYKIESNLSEKQIESDISGYLGWISPNGRARFRLLDVDEQITGADKRFDSVIPIYMQFKVSEGLTRLGKTIVPSLFSVPVPLQRIRIFRRDTRLYDNPSLYFKLRAKAKTASDFQHNVLMDLAIPGRSHAFYVAPLTTDIDRYEDLLYSSVGGRYLNDPFYYDMDEIYQRGWISRIGFVPFLRGNISIVPHEKVATHEHYYSFSPNGTEIAWHSPKVLSNNSYRLSDRLSKIFSNAFSNKESWIDIKEYAREVVNHQKIKLESSSMNDLEGKDDLDILRNFGIELNRQYDIRQFLLLSTKEFLNKLID